MAIGRPEKTDGGYSVREDGHHLSMPAFIELAQLVLGKGRTIQTRALGKSMTPLILHGDEITLAPVTGHRGIGLGDVVGYIHQTPDGQRLVVHRVVGRRDSAPCSSRT